MTLSFSVLGSGSAGNCTVVSLHGSGEPVHILIDAGLSPRATAKRMLPLGLTLDDISHILLTHLDRDHFYPSWVNAVSKHDITLHAHMRQRARAVSCGIDFKHCELCNGHIELDSETHVQTIPLAHDELGTVGFVLEHSGTRFGFATDLGRVSALLLEQFDNLHGLAIESNYDRQMQLASPRPGYLKQRIMGGKGHLSNDESLEAVLQIADQSALSQIALLHLSRQCNCPTLVTRLYADRARHLLDDLTVTSQYLATAMLPITSDRSGPLHPRQPQPAEQLRLF